MKYILRALFVPLCLLILVMFSSCSQPNNPDAVSTQIAENKTSISLWIVTEETTRDGMNHQAAILIEDFCAEHTNVTINLDILPTEEKERAIYLEKLYVLMESGNGPDIFLLPTSDILTLDYPQQYTYRRVTPLFSDVNLAMRQGYFMDISEYYDEDISLNKDSLIGEVMDAGLVGNFRYALPLRYNAPVMYIDEDTLTEYGIDINVLNSGIVDWMKYIIETGDPLLACSAEYISLNAFSNLINYDLSEISLEEGTVEQYLQLLQHISSLVGVEIGHRNRADIMAYICNMQTLYPAQIGSLENALDFVAITQAEGISLGMYPLRSAEGDWIATIRYYAAIGANCASPELAYSFIRMFLSEECQWEENRLSPANEQYNGLLERSWPVRAKGSVAPLWNNYKMQADINFLPKEQTDPKKNSILSLDLNDSFIPLLNIPVDIARFPTIISPTFDQITSELNDYASGNIAENIDFELLAKTLINSIDQVIH